MFGGNGVSRQVVYPTQDAFDDQGRFAAHDAAARLDASVRLDAIGAGSARAELAHAVSDNDIARFDTLMTWAQREFPETIFRPWLSGLRLIAVSGDRLILSAPARLERDRVRTNYLRRLQSRWDEIGGDAATGEGDGTCRLFVEAEQDLPEAMRALSPAPSSDMAAGQSPGHSPGQSPGQTPGVTPGLALGLALGLSDAFSFENFAVGPSNQDGFMLAKFLASGAPGMPPIVLFHGEPGVGKTHLLHALGRASAARNRDARISLMTAEMFVAAFVEGCRERDTSALKARTRGIDLLLIDDLHILAGKKGTEEEFFHTLRAVTSAGGRVVLTADAAPGDLTGLGDRLRQDLQGAVACAITAPDEALRAEIARQRIAVIAHTSPDFSVGEDLVDYIARHVRGTGRAVDGVIRNLFTQSIIMNKPLTLALVETAIRAQQGEVERVTMEAILTATAELTGVPKADIVSKSRRREVSRPRQIAMYLCQRHTTASYPMIGRKFGGRDHTTAMYAVRKVEETLGQDTRLAEDVRAVERLLNLA